MTMHRPTGTSLGVRTVRMEDPRPSRGIAAKAADKPRADDPAPPAADASASVGAVTLTVDDGVPIPARNFRNRTMGELHALLPKMTVTQSVAVPIRHQAAARAAVTAFMKQSKAEFTCRKLVEKGDTVFRVWRTK